MILEYIKFMDKKTTMKLTKARLLYASLTLVVLLGVGFYIYKIVLAKNIPTQFILPVPFSTQAPTNHWSRNEDCEETSLAMVYSFLNGNTENNMSPLQAQIAIDNLKKWEGVNLGYNADTGARVTTRMAQEALGLKVKQIQNYTALDLKTALVKGHPILLPINAKLLGGPQYLEDGPTYHMIVIRGFRGDIFIVNDPGTNNGDGNEYSFSILQKASANWDNTLKKLDSNKKIALIISK